PIGGVAMLASRPKPRQELWITLAGPMVNLVIAGFLLVVAWIAKIPIPELSAGIMGQPSLLSGLLIANVILFLFNMIPAFPMDGGRLLRAFLALQIGETRATKIAGTIGQVVAV